jgi:hypothetical protein
MLYTYSPVVRSGIWVALQGFENTRSPLLGGASINSVQHAVAMRLIHKCLTRSPIGPPKGIPTCYGYSS